MKDPGESSQLGRNIFQYNQPGKHIDTPLNDSIPPPLSYLGKGFLLLNGRALFTQPCWSTARMNSPAPHRGASARWFMVLASHNDATFSSKPVPF